MDMTEIDVPFRLPVRFIPDFVLGMCRDLNILPENAPQTDEGKLALYQEWNKEMAKQTILRVRTQRAQLLVQVDNSDGLLAW